MTSVQSWLLLPSPCCEDEPFYPTPLDQGSEQTLFQPLDHQATSVPSRGERASSQWALLPPAQLPALASLLAHILKTSVEVAGPTQAWEAGRREHGAFILLLLCQVSLPFLLSEFWNISQKSESKIIFVFLCKWNQEFQSN